MELFALNTTMSLPLSTSGLGLRSAGRSRLRVAQLVRVVEESTLRFLEETGDPFQPRLGWQHFAPNTVGELPLRGALPALPPPQRVLVRSQGRPFSSRPRFRDSPCSRPFSVCCSTSALPLSSRNCRCGRPLDYLGHHQSACAVAGMLGRRGFAVESAIAMPGGRRGCQRTCSCWIWISERLNSGRNRPWPIRLWPSSSDRLWPNRLWPIRLWPNRLWPNRLWPTLRLVVCKDFGFSELLVWVF